MPPSRWDYVVHLFGYRGHRGYGLRLKRVLQLFIIAAITAEGWSAFFGPNWLALPAAITALTLLAAYSLCGIEDDVMEMPNESL